jgi:hypothetical protein
LERKMYWYLRGSNNIFARVLTMVLLGLLLSYLHIYYSWGW